MFQITRDPTSRNLLQCLAKITVMFLSRPLIWKYSVFMAAYLPVVHVCIAQFRVPL